MHVSDGDRLLNLAAACVEAIRRRLHDLTHLQEELEALRGNTCMGREYWRAKHHPTRMAKLYILHSIDQVCPIHGTPQLGTRLRVYIGSDPYKIAEAREYIRRLQKWWNLERQIEALQRSLSSCEDLLRSFYDALDYTVGNSGHPEPKD